MRACAIPLAAVVLIASFLARPALPAPDEKAHLRAMEQQRKAAEAEMRKQAESERKMMEQQNRAMQAEIKAQQKMAETQHKAMQNQQKAGQNHSAATPSHITTTETTTPAYHATRPYYGHQSSGHAYRTSYRHYRTMPTQLDPQTKALHRLKASLDRVRMGSAVTAAEKSAIKKGLMGVVVVPRVPTVTSINTLAGHLANGLANRTSTQAQTGQMALSLRGALNSTELANTELTEVMNEHRSALKASKVRASEITPIMDSLKVVSGQERARR